MILMKQSMWRMNSVKIRNNIRLRVALSITGQVRDSMKDLKLNLIKPLRDVGHTVDVYMFTDIPVEDIASITQIDDSTHPHIHTIKTNSQKMFYRIYILDQYIPDGYDVVMRVRPDVIFSSPVNITMTDILTVFPRLSIPLSPVPRAMTDIFYYGNQSIMRKLSQLYLSYMKVNCNHPEQYLYNYLVSNEILYRFETRYSVALRQDRLDSFKINLAKNLTTLKDVTVGGDCRYIVDK